MKPVRTWIVVADGARARFLENQGPGKGLRAAAASDLKKQLRPNREMVTDKPGRMPDAGSPSQRSAMEPPTDWHRFEKERFAHEIAALLEEKRRAGAFDRLVLVAPPKTLGDLRKALDSQCQGLVHAELDKDLTKHDNDALTKQLGAVMAI